MSEITIPIPIKEHNDEKWILLSAITHKSGHIRAVEIEKPRQVPDWDAHHCCQSRVEGSIRFKPKGWNIL